MKFHSTHGTAITLLEGKTSAVRSENHFCNGIIFSDQPIKTGQKVCIELGCINSWSGALRIGFTVNDPSKLGSQDLPKYALPQLAKKEGYWIRPVGEHLAGDGSQLMFYISTEGNVQFFVNSEHKGALLVGLPVDKVLWLLIDIYGNTKSVKLVKSDDAPKEITARGPEAVKAFEGACMSGTRPVYRTRLMLVGQDGAGKSSLKRALLGLSSPTEMQEETLGIDLSTSCSFCVGNHDSWTVQGADTQEMTQQNYSQGLLGDADVLEEEYNQALASNIVQELMFQKRRKVSSNQKSKPGSRDSQRNSVTGAKKLSSKPSSATTSAKFSEIPAEMIKEVPDRVVELVQKMLDSSSTVEMKSQDSVSMVTRPADGTKMVLNIWDFAGKEVYYTTHQVFLTSRAVYLIVFNLTDNLEEVYPESEDDPEKISTLEYIDFWMRSIYAHASTTSKPGTEGSTYSPSILLVGTHKDCLHDDKALIDKAVEEKFAQIQDFLVGKPYVQHLVTPFYAVDNNTEEDSVVSELRRRIEDLVCQEAYMGEQMPLRWIQFEQKISSLRNQGTNHASYDQVTEVASDVNVTDYQEIMTMLMFYHDLGSIIYCGSGSTAVDNLLRNTVILNPQWLVDMFRHVVASTSKPEDKWNLIRDKWTRLEEFGILEETLLDTLWHDARDQKPVLLGLLEKFDLICQRLPSVAESQMLDINRSFYIPARLNSYAGTSKLYTLGENDVTFYIDFHGFLPNGLFQRILTHTTRWSQNIGGQNPYFMFKQVVRFFLDTEHDFVLEKAARKYSRLKVMVLRVSESDSNKDQQPGKLSAPKPEACAKVRNFLETCLSELREMWMKRISYTVCMPCPCERVCESHKMEACSQESCLHFLNLDECITNKVVMCDHRRIKTGPFKKCFPEPLSLGFSGPVLPLISLVEACGNIEKHCPALPSWVKSAAKILNSGETGRDWNALAKELGYKQNQINKFNDDLNPGLVLLADWIISSGNTGLSVDALTVYLEKIDRDDVVEIIQKAQDSDREPAQIFISYQWDNQDDVKVLRDKLERSGFTCWMDIGQLGGGDQLYNRIDEAVRQSKVVIACVSPKYIVSSHCMKELSLADLLRKPIIPVMVEKTMWPPHGGMGLIFSQLVYINMKGVGGHGGTGIHADKNDKYKEILQRVGLYASPDLSRCNETNADLESRTYIEHDALSSQYSGLEDGDGYSMGTRRSLNSAFVVQRIYEEDIAETVPPQRAAPRAVEEVHVHQCRICTIL